MLLKTNYKNDDIYEDNYSTVPERLKEISKKLKNWNNASCLAEKNSMGETNIQFLNDKSFTILSGISIVCSSSLFLV